MTFIAPGNKVPTLVYYLREEFLPWDNAGVFYQVKACLC